MSRIYPPASRRQNARLRPWLFLWLSACLAGLCASAWAVPKGEAIADSDIARAIETELSVNEGVAAHLVDVSVVDGIVTVSGSVDNLLAKDRAVEIAEAIKGVRAVVDKIAVKPVVRTDKEIHDDVVNALLMDSAADSYEVDVKVEGAKVTLTGEVDSWQEKELCAYVAKGVRGVRELQNDLTVLHKTRRPDSEIQAEIKRKLETDVRVDDLLVDVEVKDGNVKLIGTVGSAAERSRARTDAWVAGVMSVDASGLEVQWWARDEMKRRGAAAYRTDEHVKKAVKDAFLYDPRVLSFNPTVEVDGGVVTLTGEVEDLAAKRAAEDDARNTIGVWRVDNFLRVRPKKRPSDEELAKRVRDALKRDPYVERHRITVSVINGKAYLYGTVDSEFEEEQAEDVAARIAGIAAVHNGLEVNGVWTWRDDWEIRQDVLSELWWSPYVDRDQVTVTVDDGVVTLTGATDSWHERSMAETNAWEGGAKDVRNRLRVKQNGRYYPPYDRPYMP